jgi:hypothetical protein
MGAVTRVRGCKPARAADWWARPGKIKFQISKLHFKLQIQKGSFSMLQEYSNFACR